MNPTNAKTPDHFSMIGGFDYLSGGAEENWTLDLLNAIQALSQLSYSPTAKSRMTKTSLTVNTILHFFYSSGFGGISATVSGAI